MAIYYVPPNKLEKCIKVENKSMPNSRDQEKFKDKNIQCKLNKCKKRKNYWAISQAALIGKDLLSAYDKNN